MTLNRSNLSIKCEKQAHLRLMSPIIIMCLMGFRRLFRLEHPLYFLSDFPIVTK